MQSCMTTPALAAPSCALPSVWLRVERPVADRRAESAPHSVRGARTPLFTLALLVVVIVSAIGVIYTAHRSRELFRELEQARGEQNDIQIEWRQLLLERSTLSSHARVEQIADQQLQMTLPEGDMHPMVVE